MRMLITGSRTWRDKERLWHCLDKIAEGYAHQDKDRYILEGLTLVSGHARSGADMLGEWWYHERFPLEKPELYPARWQQEGGRAGFLRNERMVQTRPDSCVAFIMPCEDPKCTKTVPHGTHGATHCANYADAMGVLTTRFHDLALVLP